MVANGFVNPIFLLCAFQGKAKVPRRSDHVLFKRLKKNGWGTITLSFFMDHLQHFLIVCTNQNFSSQISALKPGIGEKWIYLVVLVCSQNIPQCHAKKLHPKAFPSLCGGCNSYRLPVVDSKKRKKKSFSDAFLKYIYVL